MMVSQRRSRLVWIVLLVAALAVTAIGTTLTASGAKTAAGSGEIRAAKLDGVSQQFGDIVVAPDRTTGRIWMLRADLDSAVYEYDPSTGVGTRKAAFRTTEYHAGTARLVADPKGGAWVASFDTFGKVDASGRFERVALPEPAQRVPASGDALHDSDRGSWRAAKITGMEVDGDGHVWMTRDFARGLLEYDPDAKRFSQHAGPDGIEVPGYLRRVGPELVVAEYRRPTEPGEERSGYRAFGAATKKWRALDAQGAITASDGSNAAFDYLDGDGPIGVVSNGEVDAPKKVDIKAKHHPGSVLAVGSGGEVWYVEDGLDLARFDPSTGTSKVYALPRLERPKGARGGAPVPSGSGYVTPVFTSAVVDADGNLWFGYYAGFSYAGVAMR